MAIVAAFPHIDVAEPEIIAVILQLDRAGGGQWLAGLPVVLERNIVDHQLVVIDDVVGDGTEAVAGRSVSVHYVGVSWSTGQQFDASWDRMEPFRFGLGGGQVIQGWDEGVAGMKVGGRRTLHIPPHLGYGVRGAGGAIKGNETLIFVVDLLGVG